MKIVILSEMSVAREQVMERLGALASGRVLVIDSASPSAGTPKKPRGGTAPATYARRGASIRILDFAETGPVDLSGVDVVHFTGGDPFRLLAACRSAGFEAAVAQRAQRSDFAVVGSSAGAMVMGRDLAHAAILCDPAGLDNLDGFGWINARIMPHLDAPGRSGDVIRAHVADHPEEDWLLLDDAEVQVLEIDPCLKTALEDDGLEP